MTTNTNTNTKKTTLLTRPKVTRKNRETVCLLLAWDAFKSCARTAKDAAARGERESARWWGAEARMEWARVAARLA